MTRLRIKDGAKIRETSKFAGLKDSNQWKGGKEGGPVLKVVKRERESTPMVKTRMGGGVVGAEKTGLSKRGLKM